MPFTLWFKELLYLRHNELRRVPCLRHCTNLKELYLGSNRIQEILPEDISSVLNIR
jgi:Leucine-rich repeat (LRR) protein